MHVNLTSRMYCPYPWSQNSHNSSPFLRIAFFCLVNVPGDAEQKSGRCRSTATCSTTASRKPLQHSSSVLSQNMYFSPHREYIFTHQNTSLLTFPSSVCIEDATKRQTGEARSNVPIRTAEFVSVPKTFYALFHHRDDDAADDFLPLTPSTDESLLCVASVGYTFRTMPLFFTLILCMDESKISVHLQVYPICQRIHCSTHQL